MLTFAALASGGEHNWDSPVILLSLPPLPRPPTLLAAHANGPAILREVKKGQVGEILIATGWDGTAICFRFEPNCVKLKASN
ncbi:hypothetical protein SLA2020_232160 [Shorea laevis]